MEVRHNTTALERALEVIAMRAEAPLLVARAAASDKIRKGVAIRRLATGAAIAIAAIGIGLGIYLSRKEPLTTAKQEVPAPKQITEDISNLPKPQVPLPLPEKKSVETTNFTIFKTRDVKIGEKTWTVTAGHSFATGEAQLAGNWDKAWCYNYAQMDKLTVQLSLGDRPKSSDVQSQPYYDPKFAIGVGLTPENIQQLATQCPWLDGKTFKIDIGEAPPPLPDIKLIGSVLFYNGAIGADFLQQLSNYEFTTLNIDSPGGLVDEALKSGRWLRINNKGVQTQKQCFSACVFVLAGGTTRQALGNPEIGVHRFKSSALPTDNDLEIGQQKSADISQYFQEMGVKNDLWLAMARTPAQDILIMTHKELVDWNLLSPDVNEFGDDSKTVPENSTEKLYNLIGYDAPGGDMVGMPIRGITNDSCEARCRNDQKCLVATYNIKAKACFLKLELVGVQKFPEAETYYRSTLHSRVTELAISTKEQ